MSMGWRRRVLGQQLGIVIGFVLASTIFWGCDRQRIGVREESRSGPRGARGEVLQSSSLAFRDSTTGRFSEPTPEQVEARSAELAEKISQRDVLTEEAGPSAAGGVRVQLRGQFSSEVTAVREKDGTIHVVHGEAQPAPDDGREDEP